MWVGKIKDVVGMRGLKQDIFPYSRGAATVDPTRFLTVAHEIDPSDNHSWTLFSTLPYSNPTL